MEIVNYATYDSATVMFDVMGFGKPMDEIPMLLQPGVLSIGWGRWFANSPPGWAWNSTALRRCTFASPHPRL